MTADDGLFNTRATWDGPGSPCRYCGSIEHNPDMPQIACIELLRSEVRQNFERAENAEKDAVERLVTSLQEEKRLWDRAIMSGLNAAMADHKDRPLTKEFAPTIVKRISGNIRGELRMRFGLGRAPRIDPWVRERKGYVCRKCVDKYGRLTCDHALDAMAAELAELRAKNSGSVNGAES